MNTTQNLHQIIPMIVTAIILPLVDTVLQTTKVNDQQKPSYGRKKGTKTICRCRRSVEELFSELSPTDFRRMYRMSQESFWKLVDILSPRMPGGKKRKRGKTVNGSIPGKSRVAMALRYFAGGSRYDIAQAHGVASPEVLKSVWIVVDAVNHTPRFDMEYPSSHALQQKIASDFQKKSKVGLNNCGGAIDGLLIWIHKPSEKELKHVIGFGDKKFFCGRKKKYGLNLQGTCDANGVFLDVEIGFPGASSDFYAFTNSVLYEQISQPGFLAPGICIYGDNAYVNTDYMIVPFRNVSSGPKDAFNYFHSSLRINIECAFGMLVHRWGILRSAMPQNIRINKTCPLVYCLCKLHNFCLWERDNSIAQPHPSDLWEITDHGGLSLARLDNNQSGSWAYSNQLDRVTDLLDGGGGEHVGDKQQRRRLNTAAESNPVLPAKEMLQLIIDMGYFERPIVPRQMT
jgi:hypothetical protein